MKKILIAFAVIGLLFITTSLIPAKYIMVTVKKAVTVEIMTGDAKYITATSASCDYFIGGLVNYNPVTSSHGLCANLAGSPNNNSKYRCLGRTYETTGDKKKCSGTLNGLTPKTKYFVRAYYKAPDGTVIYGNEKSFTTLAAK